MKLISIFFSAVFVSVCIADCYLHYPRGSNNRLNEQSANRNNANRCFDSQNNNRGGYNVGELGEENGFPDNNNGYGDNAQLYDVEYARDNGAGNTNVQYEEIYMGGSTMRTTHTIQHGCGNDKNNCNLIIEYTCDTSDQEDTNAVSNQNYVVDGTDPNNPRRNTGLRVQLRNGLNTGTPDDPNNINNAQATFNNNRNNRRYQAESEEWYAFAKQRNRNQGLFHADQKLQGNSQIYTRQNPGGTRRGLEVPEERDYYPWWYPSIWRPLLIWHNDVEECQREMADKAQVLTGEPKGMCYPAGVNNMANANNNDLNDIVSAETEEECNAQGNNAQWDEFAYDMDKPLCIQADFSQVNNLGNVEGSDAGGLPRYYDLKLPTIDQLEKAGCHIYEESLTNSGNSGDRYARLVLRMRYNMTTGDYDPYNTDSNCDQDNNQEVQSPVNQNPTVDVGVRLQGLRLALNTAQTGRVFQDRSHVFRIMDHGSVNKDLAANKATSTMNLNIQGKRGNIVQTFPAVEYDFWPKTVEVGTGECIAFQWTGSNTHNNGNPAGDGQAGDAGEGRGGSDRSNLMQMRMGKKYDSFPQPMDTMDPQDDFFANSDCYNTVTGEEMETGTTNSNSLQNKDAQIYFMTAGFYTSYADMVDQVNNDNNVVDELLNNVPATMRSITCCPKKVGEWNFMSTRNNNFSNRDQKLTIKVSEEAKLTTTEQ